MQLCSKTTPKAANPLVASKPGYIRDEYSFGRVRIRHTYEIAANGERSTFVLRDREVRITARLPELVATFLAFLRSPKSLAVRN